MLNKSSTYSMMAQIPWFHSSQGSIRMYGILQGRLAQASVGVEPKLSSYVRVSFPHPVRQLFSIFLRLHYVFVLTCATIELFRSSGRCVIFVALQLKAPE